MNLKTEKYTDYLKHIPQQGQHITGQQIEDYIIVYQAFNNKISNFAVQHQHFGGEAYSFNRMSWIKPNFLWMMYRCGWASKVNQERVLAIWIKKVDFDKILTEAVFSSFKKERYANEADWKADLQQKKVRLQWDPDHNPYGEKQERRAIQLGMKGEILKTFSEKMIVKIEDITNFVREQRQIVADKRLADLLVPIENVYQPKDKNLCQQLLLSNVV